MDERFNYIDDVITLGPCILSTLLPQLVHTKNLGLYFTVTSEDDENKFRNNEYPSAIKLGQHSFDTTIITKNIQEQLNSRSSESAKACKYRNSVAFIIFPNDTKRKVDDIVREKLFPAVSKLIDPYYRDFYTINQETGNNKAGEIAYHMNKIAVFYIALLIYDRFFNITILPEFKKKIDKWKNLPEIKDCLDKIDSKLISTTVQNENKPVKTNVTEKEIALCSIEEYKKRLFIKPDSENPKIAIISQNPKDARYLKRLYRDYNPEILYTEDVQNGFQLTQGFIFSHLNYYDMIVSVVPKSGNMSLNVLDWVILKMINRNTGKLAFIIDDSLTHSFSLDITYTNQTTLKEEVRTIHNGLTSFREQIEDILDTLEGHVNYATLENLNREFQTNSQCVFLTVHADFSTHYESFDFISHGWKRKETTLRNCTTFGHMYEFKSILRKLCVSFSESLSDRITLERPVSNTYIEYPWWKGSPLKNNREIINNKKISEMPKWFFDSFLNTNCRTKEGLFRIRHYDFEDRETDKNFIIGTEEELDNYAYNCTELSVMKYITAMTCDQCKPKCAEIVPFISDKKYTDAEINAICGFNDRELDIINYIIDNARIGSAVIKRFESGRKDIEPDKEKPYIDTSTYALF